MSNIYSTNQSSRMKSSWRIFKKKKSIVNTLFCALSAFAVLSYSTASNAQLPTGGTVANGDPTIGTAGNTMTINQTSATGIVNWDTFSIGVNNTVNFVNGTGATLNRVTGNVVSTLDGILTGQGSVYVINPNGLVVGPNGKVDVGGNFVGSTYNISDDDFINGNRAFVGSNVGTVEIRSGGQVKAGGDVALIGASVLNEGTIEGGRVTLAAAGSNGNVALLTNNDVQQISGNANALAINNKGTIRANGLTTENGRIVLRSTHDIENSGSLISNSTVSKGGDVTIRSGNDITLTGTSNIDTSNHVGGTAGSNVTIRAARDINLGGNVKTNTNGIISVSAADGNWQSGRGVIRSTVPASMIGKQVIMLSGKNADNSREDMNVQVASTGGSFTTLAMHGFNKIDTANIASTNGAGEELMTEGGTLSLIGNDVYVRENKAGGNKGDTLLIAAAFDDTTGDFETSGTGLGALVEADGWKTNTGTLNFIAPNGGATLLDICCHFAAKSGITDNGNGNFSRNDLTTDIATFGYSPDAQNNVLSFRVEGFNNFDTTVEGDLLNSSSYFIANNVNNKINYSINAGADVPAGKALNLYFTALGNVEIIAGMFDSNDKIYDDNLERIGMGTTEFVGPVNIKADEKVILVSGSDAQGNRFDLDESNVQFGYTGTDNTYTQFKAVGFNNIALGSSLLANNVLDSVGRFDLYAYNDINVSGETFEGNEVLMIAHDDINIENNSTINGTQTAVLVSDESNPLNLGGNGAVNLSADSEINGGQVGIYTRVQGDNQINGTINGLAFVPGTEFVNSSQEQWKTFYANGSNPTSPYKVYYKNEKPTTPPPPLTNNPVDCENDPSQAGCIDALSAETREFRTAQTDLTTRLTSDERLAEGQSNQVRNNEFQQVLAKNYVSSSNNSLNTQERLMAGVALPFTLVQQSLQGTQALASYVPIPGFEAILTLATKPLIAGVDIVTPR